MIFAGVSTVVLAIRSWACGWTKSERQIASSGLIGVILSLGVYTPVYPLLLRFIPGLSLFRVPARWWVYAIFALVLLAAFGWEVVGLQTNYSSILYTIICFYSSSFDRS